MNLAMLKGTENSPPPFDQVIFFQISDAGSTTVASDCQHKAYAPLVRSSIQSYDDLES